jgi:hypothetical protein
LSRGKLDLLSNRKSALLKKESLSSDIFRVRPVINPFVKETEEETLMS